MTLMRLAMRSALLLLATTLALAFALQSADTAKAAAPTVPTAPFATVITVDTSADLDSGSLSKTCTYTSGPFVAAGDGCTLRRALLEASARPPGDRPIAINFNLANDDPNANLEVVGTWTLPIDDDLPALKTQSILNLNGQVTLDGATQPGGRATGPKIIIDTNDWSLDVESESNTIRNLSFKGGGVIFLKEDSNTVTDLWMGLSDDGQEIVFRTPAQPFRMAGGGIHISSNNNLIENNTLSGAFARAVDIDGGDDNTVQNNQIGTRADGTVPIVPEASLCVRALSLDAQSWYGGWGIALSGSNNQILNNRIAGLHILQSANDTPPIAIEVFGVGHEIRDNIIGVDSDGNKVGVCGQGIKISGNSTQVIDNQIVRSRAGFEDDAQTAIMSSDSSPTFGAITVRGNIVEDGPGNVYAFGPAVPVALRTFAPAKITNINGTTLSGTSGDGSACPNCVIDLYVDDNDDNGEALTYLGSTTANASGDFTFVMAQPLAQGTGIRTSSTVQSSGIINGFGSGTTTKISKLFLKMAEVSVSGPITGDINSANVFTITVAPNGATVPLNYTVNATDAAEQTLTSENSTIVASYTWATPGVKTITVTVENDLGTVTETFQITISTPETAMDEVSVTGPSTGVINNAYDFTITVTPAGATTPLNYAVNATDATEQTLSSQNSAIVATYTWTTPGVKTITVTVENDLGTVTETFEITISAPAVEFSGILMPMLKK